MGTFCNKCNNNWSQLWEDQDNERDETYEFCPLCKTDMFLTINYNKDNLVWLPLCSINPIPSSFKTEEEYNAYIFNLYLQENNITKEQYLERIEIDKRYRENSIIEEQQRKEKEYEEKRDAREREEDERINKLINNQ
jgi:hypothetical protein